MLLLFSLSCLAYLAFTVGGLALMLFAGPSAPRLSSVVTPIDTGPGEPCWTEEIASDRRYHCCRSQCVHDALMELEARAGRGEFPTPKFYAAG